MATGDLKIKIDGVLMPCPFSFEWGLQDVSASESGRTDDAIMHKNRVSQKRKLAIAWSCKTFAESSKIIKAVNPEYISVTYPDLLTGNEQETRTFYVGDRSAPFKYWWVGKKLMDTLRFDFIEQ